MAILNLEGVAEFLKKLDGAGDKLIAAGAAALYQNGHNILSSSSMKVPVDTGTLLRSGYVTLPELQGDGLPMVEIGYGGAASQYAEVVHEGHPTKSKFLEQALDEAKGTWSSDIGELTKSNFERGVAWPSKGSYPTNPWDGAATHEARKARSAARAQARKAAKGGK